MSTIEEDVERIFGAVGRAKKAEEGVSQIFSRDPRAVPIGTGGGFKPIATDMELGQSRAIQPTQADLQPAQRIINFPPDAIHANSPQFQQILEKAVQGGLEALTDEERGRIKGAANEYPDQMGPFLQQVSQRDQPTISPEAQGLAERLSQYQAAVSGLTDIPGAAIAGAKMGADILSEIGASLVKGVEQARPTIPFPISPFRDLEKNPPTADEIRQDRNFQRLNSIEKALAVSQKAAWGGLKAAIEFPTQTLDPILNPEKHGTTSGEAFEETAAGFVDMIVQAPDQMAFLLDQTIGRNNPFSKMAEAVGTVLSGGKLITGANRQKLYEEAVNNLHENPEMLPFAIAIVTHGAAKIKGPKKLTFAEEIVEVSKQEKVNIGLTEKLKKAEETIEKQKKARAESEAARKAKQEAKPKVPETVEPTLSRIEALKPGELRSEALSIQGKDGFTAIDIAKMTDQEVQYIVSGGRIGIEPGTVKPKEAKRAVQKRPTEKITEKPPSIQEKAPKAKEDVTPEPEKVGRPKPEVQKDLDRVTPVLEQAQKTISELTEAEVGLIQAGAKANDPQLVATRTFLASEQKRLADLKIEQGALTEEIKTAPEAEIGFEAAEKRIFTAITPDQLAKRAIQIEAELLKEGKFKELADLRQRRVVGEFTDKEYISKLQDVIRPNDLLKAPPEKAQVKKPEVVDSGNKAADAGRNLAHTRRFVQGLQEAINDPQRVEFRQTYRKQLKEAKAEEKKFQAEFDRIVDEIEVTLPDEAKLPAKKEKAPVKAIKPKDPDTKAIKDGIAKMKKLDRLIGDPSLSSKEVKRLQGERQKVVASIKENLNNQTTVELGALGTPQDLINLYETVYSGMKGISEFADQTIKNAKLPPEVKAEQLEALEQMTKHRKNELEAKTQRFLSTNELKKIIPDETRWEPIIHAWEQGPRSKHWMNLSSLEKGVATWLREESQKWENFAIENELLEKPADRPAGNVHVFHHWKNPKTGKPLPAEFGRFAKTAPTLLRRKYQTVEAGQAAGLELATTNPGTLLGHTMVSLMKAQGSRGLYKNLNNVVYSESFTIRDKGKERPLMMIENWKDIEKQGLTEGYKRKSDPFLDRPIRYKDAQGNIRIIQGPVGIREEIATHWDAYRANPSITKLEKLLMASKSIVLSGLFHPVQLGMQQLARGRIPFTGIKKGLKLLRNPDKITQGLIRNGLEMDGFRDFDVNPTETLRISSDKPLAKATNLALLIPRSIAKLIFDVVHPGMKTTHAYDTFNRIWPDYEKQGLSRETAYRDAVKMSDNLFSGGDYKLALLEANKATVHAWYSASARRFWRTVLLSARWQSSHVSAFTSTTKSVVPKVVLNRFGFEDQTPIAKEYRKYLAGAVTLYTAANMMNWVNTKDMDGEGRFMFQNPEGKAFRVRAPWNNPDGSVAWIMPFKSIFEVPEAIGAIVTGDFGKFTNKLAPIIGEGIELFYNLDDFGSPQEDKGVPERLLDFGLGLTTPIVVSQIFDYMDNNKANIGLALSAFGFPVSKGLPGGLTVGREELSKKLSDFKFELRKTDKENMKLVAQDFIEGRIIEGLLRMNAMGKGTQAMSNALLRSRDRLMSNWKNTSPLQKIIFLNEIGPEEAEKFLDELKKNNQIP